MDYELKFTSAEAGVKRSAQGFCTVLATAGMPPPLLDRLESLSVYRHLYPAGQPGEEHNPVAYSHLVVPVFGESFHVVSRVQSAGLDYSKRYNYFAHHRVVDASNLPPAGPAWLAGQSAVLQPNWDGQIATPKTCPSIPAGSVTLGRARRWQELTGDAGWAGWVLQQWHGDPDGEVAVLFTPGDPTLELVQECVALLPPAARWRFTFSTFGTKLPPDVGCALRFVAAGTPEAARASGAHAIDLRSLRGKTPPTGPWADAARQGREVPFGGAAFEDEIPPFALATPVPESIGFGGNDLPPVPPPARRRRLADVTDSAPPPAQGRMNWSVAFVALVGLLLLGGAGWLFWDARRSAVELAAQDKINQEREEASRKAEAEAERAFQEQRRKADEEAARQEAIELIRKKEKEKAEQAIKEQEKQRIEQEKAKTEAAGRKERQEVERKRAEEEKDKQIAAQSKFAPPTLPTVKFLNEGIRNHSANPDSARSITQPILELEVPVTSFELHGNVLEAFDVKNAGTLPDLLICQKGSGVEVARLRALESRVECQWNSSSRDKWDSLRASFQRSVLLVGKPGQIGRTLFALRKAPFTTDALPCSWIIEKGDRDAMSKRRDPKPPDESLRARWKVEIPEEVLVEFKIDVIAELGADGNVVEPLLRGDSDASGPNVFQAEWKIAETEKLIGRLAFSKSVGSRQRWLPLVVNFTPSGSSMNVLRSECNPKLAALNQKAKPFRVEHQGKLRKTPPGAPPPPKSRDLIEIEENISSVESDLRRIGSALQAIESLAQRAVIGRVFFEVDVQGQALQIDVVRFGNPEALKPKGDN